MEGSGERTRQAGAALVLGSLLTLAFSGCGGGGVKSTQPAATGAHQATVPNQVRLGAGAYERAMRQLGRRLALSVASMYPIVETQPGAATTTASAAKVERTRGVVASVAASVAAIVPPAPIRADHQHLVKGLNELRVELDALINVLQKGGSKGFGAYSRFPGLQAIDRARVSIESKGYAIG
jgi:hypothetical protein